MTTIFPPPEDITVRETDGKETLASYGLFLGRVFGVSLPVKNTPTSETTATIHEMVGGVRFAKLSGDAFWQESQIVQLYRDHREEHYEDYRIFFELEEGFIVFICFFKHEFLVSVLELTGAKLFYGTTIS